MTGDDDAPTLRVAYTFEQCWHRVPGGMATAAVEVARALRSCDDLELVGVAGRHARPAPAAYTPPVAVRTVPVGRPWLYESWLRFGWPKVEGATGVVDVVHATGLVPAACDAPLVVTVHDLAFMHAPEQFSRHGVRVMRRSLDVIRQRAALVLCSSAVTVADCADHGIAESRLRLVPLGTAAVAVGEEDAERVRRHYRLPAEFILFLGTIEPRKNLRRLAAAVSANGDRPLVVAGVDGWGNARPDVDADVRFIGFVPPHDLAGLYRAASVFAYPSEREGFGLPVLDAMAQGTPVVTSRGTSTEEVAGDAAELVDPFDVDSIADGLARADARRTELGERGRHRAAAMTWQATARATMAAYREAAR
jgi:glycosyltransferase involved in cell wall biosynthesis